MGSQVKKVLLQGIWGSLTGGWYFDPRHSKFTNVFHLYTWLILMILPFIFYLVPVAIPSWGLICSYTATVFAIFASIKVVNYRLHETFDKGEVVKREVEPTESDIGNNSVSSPHADLGDIAGSHLTAADLFPIHNVAELPEKQNNLSGAGDGNSKVGKEGSEDGNNAKPVTVGEVDVHAAPVDLFQAESNNNKDNVVVTRTKRRRVRRQKRSDTEPACLPHYQERTKKKSVAFAEVSGHTKKARNVSRCVSLPSATSDSEDETDSYGSNSTADSEGTSDSLHDDNRGNVLRVKRSERPQRRRAVRGHRHQAWHESRRRKLRIKNVTRVDEGSCESSDADDKFLNTDVGSKDKDKLHEVAAKKDTSNRQALLEEKINQNGEIVQRPDFDKTASVNNVKPSTEAEKELPTSDQELLSRDPVWRAQRSQRYSSNRRPFFRRRSYTVNSLRQVTPVQDTRRGSFTVPPYNGRTFSSPRPTPSSLKKLLSLWTREQNPSINEIVPSSPGEVSPGEVRLMGLLVDNSHLPNTPMNSTVGEENVATTEAADKNGTKTDNNASRNSNPHFSETHTPERKAEENKKKVLVTDGSHHKKHKPKKAARSKSSGATRTTEGNLNKSQLRMNEDALFDLFNQKRPDTPIPSDSFGRDFEKLSLTSTDSENEMNDFVNKLIGDREAWQGSENVHDHHPSTAEASSTIKCSRHRTTSLPAQSTGNDNLLDAARLNESLEGQLKEPEPGDVWHYRASAAGDSRTRTVSQSSRGRRVRHPAGESHSRLASNTSEEGSAATTSHQLSATHIAENSDGTTLDNIPPTIVEKLKGSGEAPGAHIATEHNDTTTGAVHAFQDEHGNWLTYTFGESSGTAQMLSTNVGHNNRSSTSFRQRRLSSAQGGGSSDDERSPREISRDRTSRRFQIPSLRRLHQLPHRGMDLSAYMESDDISGSLNQGDWPDMSPIGLMLDRAAITRRRPTTPKVKLSYKFQLLPFKSIILRYDRLSLLDLLDRNRHIVENLLVTFLAMIVAVLGLLLLQKGFFLDIWTLWFCVVIATAQYSLINSVQPDSASPTHGHNHVIAYSRPIYFCILALLILLFDYLGSGQVYVPDSYIYAGLYLTKASCLVARNILLVFIKVLPFVFLLGLLPQIDTFVMYVSEQTEIHMFGGSACNSLPSALFSLTRSIVFCLCLFGFCYGGMKAPTESQNILFSVFCGLLVSVSYHLSRQTNDPLHVWNIIRAKFLSCKNEDTAADADTENGVSESRHDNPDELSTRYVNQVLSERLQSDLIVCPLLAIFAFAIHCSTAFTVLQPALSFVLYTLAGVFGFTLHYLLPQLRKNLPWLLFSSPILKAREYGLFEVTEEARIMWFERAFIRLTFIERNFIYPLVIMNQLTVDAGNVVSLYGLVWGCVILTFVSLKLLRSSYGITLMHYAALVFSLLYIKYDTRNSEDSILVTYFLTTILFVKFQDLMLKLQFVYVYIAPWQITWGSTFHAFAQPISVPHSGMLLVNTVISSLLHAPLAPFLGSAIFLTSYMRPLKFWEKNYKTKRVDHSNTRLAAQIDRGPSTDDNNLNSLFYEHLTLALQKSLCGDIEMGRWGNVYPGDCFVMTSDYLNALVHIIQIGNGVINFQVRGLEFSGTYCQQREVEAISETIDNRKCCCCSIGHPKNMLSFNMALQRRWLAWQIQTKNFVLDGYSITDISATSMLGVYDLRKVLLSYMVKSVVYFLIMHDSLEKWLNDEGIKTAISSCEVQDYVDVDTSFSVTIHEDYDMWLTGISRTKFEAVYGRWVQHCASKRIEPISNEDESKLVTLCFMVSILCRRALGTASVNLTANHVAMESFMYGLHSLFKGDFRITSSKDEWIFNDMDLLHNVVVPGVRMAVKLHLDHFQNMDEDDHDWDGLYRRISQNMDEMVITHEGDPEWRKAVLSNRDSLLALRHLAGDSIDSYFVVTLKKRCQGFLVVRINRESVKGLWAGQQQELVFLRNSNPERGSIQNAKQVLRNMINSSCDQPIGYPIYVSPVTTSFSNTHPSYKKIAGRSVSSQGIRNTILNLWTCLVQSCAAGCNSGGSVGINLGHVDHIRSGPAQTLAHFTPPTPGPRPSVAESLSSGSYIAMTDQIDQFGANRLSKNSSHRSICIDGSRGGRSSTEELTQQSHAPWSRSSARWRSGYDGGKGHSHSRSGNVSSDMSLLKIHSLRTRNHQKDSVEERSSNDPVGISSRPSIASEDVQSSNLPTPEEGWKNSNITAAATMGSENSSGSGHLTEILAKSSTDVKATKSTDQVKRTQQGKKRARPSRSRQTEPKEYAKVTDPSRVLGTLEIQRRVDHVKWPNDEWRKFGGKSKWGDWTPTTDTMGEIVFRWYPNHRDPNLRSHIGEVILLLRVKSESSKNHFYVPIPEKCTSPHKPEIETTQF